MPIPGHGCNDAMLAAAGRAGAIKTGTVRGSSTGLEAGLPCPTDLGRLTNGVAYMARFAVRLQTAGLAIRTIARERARTVRQRAQ